MPEADWVIAADSGVDRALAVGRSIDVAIGDFDSVSADGLAAATNAGASVQAYPAAKNETDLELALLHAVDIAPDRIWVCALDGGRPDHFLANLLLLADRRFASAEVVANVGDATLTVVHCQATLEVKPAQLVSILPVGGDAVGVRTAGLEYPLDGETLAAGSPRGMSNVAADHRVTVTIGGGAVVVIT